MAIFLQTGSRCEIPDRFLMYIVYDAPLGTGTINNQWFHQAEKGNFPFQEPALPQSFTYKLSEMSQRDVPTFLVT